LATNWSSLARDLLRDGTRAPHFVEQFVRQGNRLQLRVGHLAESMGKPQHIECFAPALAAADFAVVVGIGRAWAVGFVDTGPHISHNSGYGRRKSLRP